MPTIEQHTESTFLTLPPQKDDSSSEGSFSEDTSSSPPSKRARCHIDSNVIPHRYNWDGFVRQGSHLKCLVEATVDRLLAQRNEPDLPGEEPHESRTVDSSITERNKEETNSTKIAREKTAECMNLQRKLEEAEAEAITLRASNKSLQESTSSTNSRLERALEALKIAGQNAATARADCDAAESFASSLANQVETLRSTIEETKRSAQQVYKEHKEIASEARLIESKLIAQVSGFARTKKEHQSTLLDHEKIKKQCDEMKQIQISMQHQMDKKDQQIKRLQQDIDGRDAMEDARKERSELIEKELREARALLVEVSSTQQESESTASILKETIETIKIENNELHQKLAETQKKMRSDLEKSQELLASAEKESQMLRVRASAHDADIKRVQAEKASSDKKITSLRHRLETFERRLWHHDSADSTPQINDVATSYGLESDGARKKFIIPPLVPGSKLQIKSQSCSICGKEASGVMKSCQCSSISCDKRAHSTCISTQSTKSFGIGLNLITPARKIVLCSHEKTPQQN